MNIIKKNPLLYIKLVLPSLFLWLALFAFSNSVGSIARDLVWNSSTFFMRIAIGLAMFLAFLLVPPLVYSFFKFIILRELNTFFCGQKPSFTLFWRFYICNLVIFVFLNAMFILWMVIALGVNNPLWFEVYAIVTLAPIGFFAYSFINIFHSILIKRNSAKAVREALAFTFCHVKSYAGFIVLDVIILTLFLAVWYAATRILFPATIEVYQSYGYFIFFSILFYFSLAVVCGLNQIYFYRKVLS